jgi:hypothetical protein
MELAAYYLLAPSELETIFLCSMSSVEGRKFFPESG